MMSKSEALNRASDAGLDLVLISPNAKPPVARIMDYGKYRFEQQKKLKESRKKSKTVSVNGILFEKRNSYKHQCPRSRKAGVCSINQVTLL